MLAVVKEVDDVQDQVLAVVPHTMEDIQAHGVTETV